MQVREVIFEFREGTAAEWTAVNPTLRAGEPGYERDTNKLKIGNGQAAWNDLAYLVGSGGGGAVDSVFGRIGVITAQTGDYTKAQIGLSVVDNTADLNKPLSNSAITALAGKLDGPIGEIYPISSYGFVAISAPIETFQNDSDLGCWVARIWVPPNTPISKVGTFVTVTGAVATTGENGFAVYSDAGALLSSTVNDNNLWTNFGWVIRDLQNTIAAQASGRFVRAAISLGNTSPIAMYVACPSNGTLMYQGGVLETHRRAWAVSNRNDGWPATIDVVNEGTHYSFLPIIVLA